MKSTVPVDTDHISIDMQSTSPPSLMGQSMTMILEQSVSNPQLLINSNNEIYGVCGHRPHFHRHLKHTPPCPMGQSMMKEPAQHTKLPQILLGATTWKHCEDQQKEIIFYLFPEH